MQKYVIALYIRLSIEDYKYDSLSIENQSQVRQDAARRVSEQNLSLRLPQKRRWQNGA